MCSGGTGRGVGEVGTWAQHPPGCSVCQEEEEGLNVGQMGAERVPPSTQGFASLGSSGCFSPFMSPTPRCGCVAVLAAVPCCFRGVILGELFPSHCQNTLTPFWGVLGAARLGAWRCSLAHLCVACGFPKMRLDHHRNAHQGLRKYL